MPMYALLTIENIFKTIVCGKLNIFEKEKMKNKMFGYYSLDTWGRIVASSFNVCFFIRKMSVSGQND